MNGFQALAREVRKKFDAPKPTSREEYSQICEDLFDEFQGVLGVKLKHYFIKERRKKTFQKTGVVVFSRKGDQLYLGASYCSPRESFDKNIGCWEAVKEVVSLPLDEIKVMVNPADLFNLPSMGQVMFWRSFPPGARSAVYEVLTWMNKENKDEEKK